MIHTTIEQQLSERILAKEKIVFNCDGENWNRNIYGYIRLYEGMQRNTMIHPTYDVFSLQLTT